MGTGWVPSEVYVLRDLSRAFLVDWEDGEPQQPEREGRLEAFAALAHAGNPEKTAEAVAGFVRRFGTLHVCAEHKRPFLSVEHSPFGPDRRCTLLKPEPVPLWSLHAERVSDVLQVMDALTRKREPGPVWSDLKSVDSGGFASLERFAVEIERLQRTLPFPGSAEHLRALHEENTKRWEELAELERQAAKAREKSPPPSTEKDWRRWVARQIEFGLWMYPPHMAFTFDQETGKLQPTFSTASNLSAVYLWLAFNVAGAKRIAFCDCCGKPHSRKRAPKRGQAADCEKCRKSSARQRRYAGKLPTL